MQCSNTKSVMVKSPMNLWPFTVIHPPYPPQNQKMIRLLMTTLDYTQMQVYKRLFGLAVLIWIVWLLATKRLTLKKLRKWKTMISMAISMATAK